MKKIILDCDLMRYRHSGLYHYCLNLGNHVRRILEKEHREKIAFYIPPAEKNSFDAGANCIVERKWHDKFFKPFLWDCDIWHAPFQSGRVVPAGKKKIKTLLTIHDLNCLHEGKSMKVQMESLQKTQKLIDYSDAIVCISHHCKKDVLENMEVSNKPLYVIHNGTHHVSAPPVNPDGYKPAMPFIFAMGYVNQKKNFHTLVPLLKDPGIELVVAGRLDEPDYIKDMQKLAERLAVTDRLHILGPVAEKDKAWYFKNCLAFMLPSLAEGFGAPVVEAMKFGKPIFLSNLTSLPEIGGDAAFYFNDFEPDNMQQVFNQGLTKYRNNGMADAIMKRGNDFEWEDKARQYIEVYKTLL